MIHQSKPKKEINKKEILSILNFLDRQLDGIQRKIKLYCVGGTFLILANLRKTSKDVDFITDRKDFLLLTSHIAELEWKQNIQFDIFPEGFLPDYKFVGYKNNATKASIKLNNIEVYYLDIINFVLSKALAGRERDILDIKLIAPSSELIPKNELIRRFNQLKISPNKIKELTKKFNFFIEEFYKE